MQVLYTKQELNDFVADERNRNNIIGFVPTMGALHRGHLSLIEYALANSDITVASIFVNPTQFNNADDLKNYPRTTENDLQLLENIGCHAVFVPDVKEMYPEPDVRQFDFNGLDTLMEGEHRPGHFNGVAQIVSKLFDAVQPHKAFFGLKDFQQVAIIRKMVEKLDYNIEIVACPIVRERDGLAMSSRNQLLTDEFRSVAPVIYQTLKKSQEKWKEFKNTGQVIEWVCTQISNTELLSVEYFEIVHQNTLKPVEQSEDINGHIGCIAVWAGKVRLIDNFIYNY